MNSASIHEGLEAIARALPSIERELNEADAKLGDGDTGGMIARVVRSTQSAAIVEDVGAYILGLSDAANSATGSSLGNLIATALRSMGRRVRGQSGIAPSQLSDLLISARDSMLERGGAELGDKTVVDSVNALCQAASGLSDWNTMAGVLRTASRKVLEDFRGKPIRIGRARMFGEATKNMDDPGMLAIAMLLDAAQTK